MGLYFSTCNKAAAVFKNEPLFQYGRLSKNDQEVTQNKAALSTKKPLSAPGFMTGPYCARYAPGRSGGTA
jgi:hypothetical protein